MSYHWISLGLARIIDVAYNLASLGAPMKKIAVLALLLLSPAVRGADPYSQVWTVASGNESCGKWIEARNNLGDRNLRENWVFGFLSGMNWAAADAGWPQAKPVDNAAALAFVDHYCASNPLHALRFAARALVSETGGPKALHQWKW
jgi:hypothetical protein